MDERGFIRSSFIDIELTPETFFIYQIRKNILRAFQEAKGHFNGVVVDLGCGYMPYRELILENQKVTRYVGIDLEQPTYYGDVSPDMTWDGENIPFQASSVDCVIATEVLEHCFEPKLLLRECRAAGRSIHSGCGG